jgi:glycosyltransferase involved in cell wall biosynthesis
MNDGSVKVSVIVAAYNAADTIDECLYSLCRQSLSGIEVIVVDDCSLDQTSTIVAQWVQKDPRFGSFVRK